MPSGLPEFGLLWEGMGELDLKLAEGTLAK